MNIFSFNLDFFNQLHYRFLLGVTLFGVLLAIIFKDVWLNHPLIIYLLLIIPYIFYFAVCFMTFHIVRLQKYRLWFLLLPGVVLLVLVYPVIKWYYYSFLTAHGVVLYFPWKDGDAQKLFIKIVRGLSFVLLILGLDTFFWQKKQKSVKINELQLAVKDISDNALLSGHFLFKLYQFSVEKKIVFDLTVLDFFQYIINKIAMRDSRVALDEEWAYFKQLVDICVHRKIEIKGEELVPAYIWNRSVPTLSLMTWIENAVSYSPIGKSFPIVIEWIREKDATVFTVRNRIAGRNGEKGTGRGLILVNRLFESLQKDRVNVAYRIEEEKYFVVELKFMN
ncbi:hypothetical protein [Sphingobacterium prati]|uniref:hypothetical protein n=1 Tax=Sphingobacterium prati TaxID=2737006 RepID=UPI001551F60B|nr:hypothetical protein [Sphingobacterium prati]NPE46230.1 hypothetical protein [Sphingobacterium prati]